MNLLESLHELVEYSWTVLVDSQICPKHIPVAYSLSPHDVVVLEEKHGSPVEYTDYHAHPKKG
jgi:hypothetical protein